MPRYAANNGNRRHRSYNRPSGGGTSAFAKTNGRVEGAPLAGGPYLGALTTRGRAVSSVTRPRADDLA
jgi:hypothetical protein